MPLFFAIHILNITVKFFNNLTIRHKTSHVAKFHTRIPSKTSNKIQIFYNHFLIKHNTYLNSP